MTSSDRSRYNRWCGLIALTIARVRRQLTTAAQGRLIATVLIVAVTVANLILVTGVALALADEQALAHDAAVQVHPDEGSVQSSVAGVEPPRLGATHERAAMISEREGVTHASPVLAEPIQVKSPETGHTTSLLVVGVVPGSESAMVAGLPTGSLTAGDPFYEGGGAAGGPPGEIVLSTAAGEKLNASTGETLTLASVRADYNGTPTNETSNGTATTEPVAMAADYNRTAAVTAIEPRTADNTEMPVALVHLSTLQSLTNATDADLADQVLIWGDQTAAQAGGTAAYPNATVETADTTQFGSLFDDTLALVTTVLALVIAGTICSLFVATTTGLTVEADRQTLAMLEAIGFPVQSRLLIIAVTAIVTTGCGAVLGLGLGIGGILVVNALATATIAPSAVAAIHPLFLPYALGIALVSAVVALPYPLVLAARTNVLAEVGR
ncbi:FtsX-like permease family protein [Natrinema soli]|uniref:FtsX-like permease family protein n=1 Tax=Natrinema soli TaxID=1930624 RepID=A0ABD5SLW3_9EURY|nr:FtsX-like permease family protein [Natrinema soli]